MSLPEGLLDDVKNYLNITWEDNAEDRKISGIIARGIAYINRIAGEEMDYTAEDTPRELLFDYCMYDRSGGSKDFEQHYMHRILALQIDRRVANYVDEDTDV